MYTVFVYFYNNIAFPGRVWYTVCKEVFSMNDKPIFDKAAYDQQYKRDKLKRIPLDVPLAFYDKIKAAAAFQGVPVNTFIKSAIQSAIDDLQAK